MPLTLPPPATVAYSPMWRCADAAIAMYIAAILALVAHRGFIKPLLISYTGWSWCIIGLRALCSCAGAALGSSALLRVAESVRFAALVQATVTSVVWNFALMPYLLFKRWGGPDNVKERRAFLNWNFSFVLVNFHNLNVPLACVNTVYGGGARALTPSDLWSALVIGVAYAFFYLCLLDRLGVHLYPIFSPRTHWSAVMYAAWVGIYVAALRGWNALIEA